MEKNLISMTVSETFAEVPNFRITDLSSLQIVENLFNQRYKLF